MLFWGLLSHWGVMQSGPRDSIFTLPSSESNLGSGYETVRIAPGQVLCPFRDPSSYYKTSLLILALEKLHTVLGFSSVSPSY